MPQEYSRYDMSEQTTKVHTTWRTSQASREILKPRTYSTSPFLSLYVYIAMSSSVYKGFPINPQASTELLKPRTYSPSPSLRLLIFPCFPMYIMASNSQIYNGLHVLHFHPQSLNLLFTNSTSSKNHFNFLFTNSTSSKKPLQLALHE